ncbi:oxidoreductase [Paenibacillus sp. GSMTC-2017]|uniref:oxidoreductase n=1 Tax=Paenibacillus sp. GSMTC-2017 TaxID=2794350 RepID=UPI0018D6784E|nr:oxidoreductase [Paenibacillus sp. GSMTC-2017]MBH5316518.1 oxidoreductase [Paenibacillus sp. GSMTC-2017]
MKTINHIETRLSSRYEDLDPNQDGNKNTQFADFIIDGDSLYKRLSKYEMVPALGWGTNEHQKLMIDYLLLKQRHEYLYYRYPILVCPWCGDEECGFISVSIDREEDIVIWQDFRLESENKKIDIGPFYFDWKNYSNEITKTYTK